MIKKYTTPKETCPSRPSEYWLNDDRTVLYSPHYRAMFGLEQVEGFHYVEKCWEMVNGEIDGNKTKG